MGYLIMNDYVRYLPVVVIFALVTSCQLAKIFEKHHRDTIISDRQPLRWIKQWECSINS